MTDIKPEIEKNPEMYRTLLKKRDREKNKRNCSEEERDGEEG